MDDYFQRADWTYVHTAGAEGTRPAGASASAMFPWGGQAVLRSNYTAEDALWAWFDVGPEYGSSGHAHRSKLAVNLRAWGSMLLVDSGRFQYNGQGLSEQLNREYERTTSAHNTLTFDGRQQSSNLARVTSPTPNSSWSFAADRDFVRGASSLYDGLEGSVTHQRGVLYVKSATPPFLVIVDRVTTDRATRADAFHT